MIRAVVFDCFGVLTTDGWKRIREEFFANDDQAMQEAMDMDKAVNAGFMDYDNFIRQIATMTGLQAEAVKARLNSSSPNELLYGYIRDELKPRFKVGMLSNAADDWLEQLFESWQRALFDEVVLSYQIGAVKPESRAYEAVASRLGVTLDECVFVDDREDYCDAARELGMSAVHHDDTHATIAALKELVDA